MSATFPPIAQDTLTAMAGGDERALEQVFRALYDALLARARSALRDDHAAAPRLIAGVVREMWAQRAALTDAARLEGFVNEEIRHRAAATRSRLVAVHRFEKTEGVQATHEHAPPTADQLWGEIVAALHAPVADPATVARRRREHAKHDAAQHISRVAERRSWKGPVAVGVIATVIGVGAFYWMTQSSRESVVLQMLAGAEQEAVTTRAGQLGSLTLSDGTGARLAPESRLVTVPQFGKKYRTARVAGSVSFSAPAGAAVPLEVRTGDAVVTLAQGAVTLRNYPNDPAILVRADDGDARVSVGRQSRSISAGQVVAVTPDGAIRDATDDEGTAFAWTDGTLVLKGATVAEAVQAFRRWYAVDIAITDDAIRERTLTIAAPLESSRAAIAAVEAEAGIQFAWVDNKMTFRAMPPATASARRR